MKVIVGLMCVISLLTPCFAASFQDIAGQKKGSGDTDLLFFRPQSSTQNTRAETSTKTAPETKQPSLSPQQKTDNEVQGQKPGKWATSIKGIRKK